MSQPPKQRARGRATAKPQPLPSTRAPGGMRLPTDPSKPGPTWPRPPNPAIERDVASATRQMSAATIHGGGNGNGGNGNGGNGGNGGGNGGDAPPMTRALMRAGGRLENITRTRPANLISKQGVEGQKLRLISNYFKLEKKPSWVIYQYRVDFTPPDDRRMVMRAYLKQHKDKIGSGFLFDNTNIFTSQLFHQPNETLVLTSFDREKDNAPVKIEIRLVGQVSDTSMSKLQVYNLIVKQCMGPLELQLVGRNLFDAKAEKIVRSGLLKVWPGYVTSIRQHERDLLMCTEITHKVLREDTAYDLMKECHRDARGDFQTKYTQLILGQTVLTPYNNATYRIDDVAFDMTPASTFDMKGHPTRYIDYYKSKYGITIHDIRQPLLLSKPKSRDLRGGKMENIYLVPEMCKMTGLTDKQRADFALMRDLSGHVHLGPNERLKVLEVYNHRLQSTPQIQSSLKEWDMALGKDFVKVDGRLLPSPKIVLGRGIEVSGGPTADWTRTSQSKPMYICAKLNEWAAVVPQNLEADAKNMIKTMRGVAEPMGFPIPEPSIYTVGRDTAAEIVRAIEDIIARSDIKFILVVVSNNSGDRYSAIKKKCYIDRAISSQVVTKRVLTGKNLITVATKIAIQINTKLGGAPWTVALPKADMMVVGFDVCHDASDKSKSVGAFVASSNPLMSSWYCNATPHTSGEELANSITIDVQAAVRRWVSINGKAPMRILIYRDGVGDSQIHHILNHEVEQIKKALKMLYGETEFKLGYILVTKRINTRLFMENRVNPAPGTVVDDVITLPEKYDFLMISQSAKQGTVMPTYYNIIYDELGVKPDQLQKFTFSLTHLYYNLSSTVRVPAPVQYAHKLAFLVSQSLHRQPNPAICDRLFFI